MDSTRAPEHATPMILLVSHFPFLELVYVYLHSSTLRTAPEASRRRFGNCETNSCHEVLQICNRTPFSRRLAIFFFSPHYLRGLGEMYGMPHAGYR